METWHLFVDESGDFKKDQDVDVAAILIQDELRSGHPAQLRASLERAVPGLPRPLHAGYL